MSDLPVGKTEEEENNAAVEAFKKTQPTKKRAEIQTQATKYLAQIRDKLAEGFVIYAEDDVDEERPITVPEQILARMLAGKDVEWVKPEEEKPLVVTKGPPINEGQKP